MSIYDNLSQRPAGQGVTQQQALAQLKSDPRGMLKRAGMQIPDGMSDPMQMVNYLLQSGQAGGPRAQMVRQIMARMGR